MILEKLKFPHYFIYAGRNLEDHAKDPETVVVLIHLKGPNIFRTQDKKRKFA